MSEKPGCEFTPSRCIIDLAALVRNFRKLGEAEKLMPVVKSDAYGHGLLPVVRALDVAGARQFAVGTVSEGLALRAAGFGQTLVPLLGVRGWQTSAGDEWQAACQASLTPLLTSLEDLELADAASRQCGHGAGSPWPVAIKLETGMGRLGFSPDQIPALADRLRSCPALRPVILLSHLACADMPEKVDYSHRQISQFEAMCASLAPVCEQAARSIGNSPATLCLPEANYDLVRPGLAIYGGNPLHGTSAEASGAGLEWVMEVTAPVLQVRKLAIGQSLSYGGHFVADRPVTVAVLGIGYAAAYPRGLSGRGSVLLHGRRCQQVGRVCMGMMMVDISGLEMAGEKVSPGDTAWILGGKAAPGQKPVTVQEMADGLDTIPYELLCLFGNSNPREYIG